MFMPWDQGEKPFFINPEGVEWYWDKSSTQYAQNEDKHGTRLPDIVCVITRHKDGWDRLLMNKVTNDIITSGGIEQIGVFIDKLKLEKRFDQHEK